MPVRNLLSCAGCHALKSPVIVVPRCATRRARGLALARQYHRMERILELRTYLRILRRRRRILVLGLLLGLLGSLAILTMTTPTFESRATVFFASDTNGTDTEYQGRQFAKTRVSTYALLATSNAALDEIIEELELPMTTEELADAIDAEAETDTVLVNIIVSDPDAKTAQRIAQAIAEKLASTVPLIETNTSGAGDPAIKAAISDPASLPDEPVEGTPVQTLILAPLVGLILAGVGAVLQESLSPTAGLSDSIEGLAGAPVLGTVLHDSRSATDVETENWVAASQLVHRAQSTGTRVFTVAPIFSGTDSSLPSKELAVAIASVGESVILLNANFQHHGDEQDDVASQPGLSEVLRGTTPIAATIQTSAGLSFVPPGTALANSSELLRSSALTETLQTLRERFSIIIISSAPVLTTADSTILAERTDGTILVARPERTKSEHLTLAVRRLEGVGVTPFGVLLDASRGR